MVFSRKRSPVVFMELHTIVRTMLNSYITRKTRNSMDLYISKLRESVGFLEYAMMDLTNYNVQLYVQLFDKDVQLFDEIVSTGKGSNSTISYVHRFLANYGMGEKNGLFHADNCAGINRQLHNAKRFNQTTFISGLNFADQKFRFFAWIYFHEKGFLY